MSVIIDQAPLGNDNLGLRTVGELLSHLRRENRLVVNLLIDGLRPDLSPVGDYRRSPLVGRTIFIETASARETALDVLDDVPAELDSADRSRFEAIDLLQKNEVADALTKLGRCFSAWQLAEQSVLQTSQLLAVDTDQLDVGGQTLPVFLQEFTQQLHQIKDALVNQDYVVLSDMLQYETTETSDRWRLVIGTLRAVAEAA